MKEYELKDIRESNDKFILLVLCAECREELNRTIEMTGKELGEHWLQLVLGSGFNAGKCKKGCRSTYSDLNVNTKLVIIGVK